MANILDSLLLKAVAAGISICCMLCVHGSGQEVRQPAPNEKKAIPDAELLNQDGKKIHFYSDLIKDKVVIVSFFFTSCTLICPMQGEKLSKLQAMLGERP